MKTKQEVQEALTLLCHEFNVPVPDLDFSSRTTRGNYFTRKMYFDGEVLQVGPNCWRGLEDALVHEFAHHLTWIECKTLKHGTDFKRNLVKAVRAWFGCLSVYGWQKEYKALAAHGRRLVEKERNLAGQTGWVDKWVAEIKSSKRKPRP